MTRHVVLFYFPISGFPHSQLNLILLLAKEVALYTDYKLDESYTPTRISVRVGTNFNDLQEIEVISCLKLKKNFDRRSK